MVPLTGLHANSGENSPPPINTSSNIQLPVADFSSIDMLSIGTNFDHKAHYQILADSGELVEKIDPLRPHRSPMHNRKYGVAVIIGNQNYGNQVPAARYAHNDAQAIKSFALQRLDFSGENIIEKRDATKLDLEKIFGTEQFPRGQLNNWVEPGKSDVLVYYSGHGTPGLTDNKRYLLPVDGDPGESEITGYPLDLLMSNLAKLAARSVTVYIDSCFSGQSQAGYLIRNVKGLVISSKAVRPPDNLTVITASREDQVAHWDEGSRHGLFTQHLLDALYGAADLKDFGNEDGVVSLGEVKNYLESEMSRQVRKQFNRRQDATAIGSDTEVLAYLSPSEKPLARSPEYFDAESRSPDQVGDTPHPANESWRRSIHSRQTSVPWSGSIVDSESKDIDASPAGSHEKIRRAWTKKIEQKNGSVD